MRHNHTATAGVIQLLLSLVLLGQAGPGNPSGLSITGYHFVSEAFYSRTQSRVTYVADLANNGPAQTSVIGTLTSTVPGMVIPGQDVIHFPAVPGKSVVSSNDTFSILVDRTIPFNFNSLQWALQGNSMVSDVSVGKNLQSQITITLPVTAGSGGTDVYVTSSDPTKVLLGPQAAQQTTVHIAEGATTGLVIVEGLDSSGSAVVVASPSGLTSGTGIVTLSPSGFVVSGPNGIGQPVTAGIGANLPLTLTIARLDASGNFVEPQALRSGTGTVTIHLSSSNPTVGSVSPSSVTFSGADITRPALFSAFEYGTTTLEVDTPAGFSLPSQGASIVATVLGEPPSFPVTVGKGLETSAHINLSGPVQTDKTPITITSDDPTKLLLSATPDGFGSASITLNLSLFTTVSPDFFVYGLTSSGAATYTASTLGHVIVTGTVNFGPSGFILVGPGGMGASSFLTTPSFGDTPLTVRSALLNANGSFSAIQDIAGGTFVNVGVTSSNLGVGTITTSPVSVAGGSSTGTTAFHPVSAGVTTLSVATPPGFTTPTQYQSLTATSGRPPVILTGDQNSPVTIGNNLQVPGIISIAGAQPTITVVTLTSNNPAILKLSNTASGSGATSIQVTIPAGSTNAQYYIQAFASSGTASYTSTAAGFTSRVASQITLAQSGVVMAGPLGFFVFAHKPPPVVISLEGGPSPITVTTCIVNPDGTLFGQQQLAGGQPLSIPLNNSDPTVGTLPQMAVIQPGDDSINVMVTPLTAGQTRISVTQPAGFTAPTHGPTILDQPFTSLVVRVVP